MKAMFATACLLAAGVFAASPQSAPRADIAGLLERLEQQADDFEDAFEDALEKTVLDDTNLADRLKDQAEKLEEEIGDLRSDYKGGKDIRERLDRVLARASDINKAMLERRFTEDVQRRWNEIRAGLNELAAAYGLQPLRAL
jgi:hypothetical protein